MTARSMVFVLLATVSVSVFGCAKDRSLEDYESERTSERLGKIQERAGAYSGELISDGSDGLIAGIVMNVSSDTKIQAQGGEVNGPRQVGFQGSILIKNAGSDLRLGFTNAYYDFSNGNFRITAPIQTRNGAAQNIELEGYFTGDRMVGVIYAAGYSDFAAHFDIARGGDLPSAKRIGIVDAGALGRIPTLITKYSGTIRNPLSGLKEKATLKILNLPNTQESFLNFFIPVQTVDLQVQLGDFGVNYETQEYKNSQLDKLAGTLIGKADRSGITCRQVLKTLSWQCQIDGGSGTLDVTFNPVETSAGKALPAKAAKKSVSRKK